MEGKRLQPTFAYLRSFAIIDTMRQLCDLIERVILVKHQSGSEFPVTDRLVSAKCQRDDLIEGGLKVGSRACVEQMVGVVLLPYWEVQT